MGAYSYQALDAKGKKVKGVIEGDSERHVRSQLRGRQLKPLDVKSTSSRQTRDSSGKSTGLFGARLNYRDVSLLTRQLASLVQSGLPLDEVLASTAKQTRKAAVKSVMLQVRSRVREGVSLHQALAEQPKVFDSLYRAMVRAGESSGYLGPVLEQLAEYTERSQETRQKLQSAMVYPIIMLVASIGIIAFMMTKVVPTLTQMFESGNRELPTITKVLIALSDFTVDYGWLMLLLIAGIAGLCKWLLQSERRRRRWHSFLLRVPLVGMVISLGETARYSSTLGLLVNSGVPLLESLKIATQVLVNTEMKEASKKVVATVQEGGSLAKGLDQVKVFPPLLVQMAASGEANGKLAEQLLHAARNQERELEFSVNTAMALLQPLMVLTMASIVLFIIIAVLLPIFEMNELVGL